MEKINITIPDNLTYEQEVFAIAQQLGKKMLPPKNKLLGSGYTIKHLETQIIIKREEVEKPIVTKECGACGDIFEVKTGKSLWTNYGGTQKKRHYCTDECRDIVMAISGPHRAAIKKSHLKIY